VSLTVRDARLDDAVVAVRVEDDRIVALGADVEPEAGDDVLDAAGMAVVPGLVNGHTHAAMTLMRGYGGDLPLMTWLQDRIFPIEAKLTADDVYWGTRLACVEMIRSGTVRFWDMYWQPEAVARAVQDAGIRAPARGRPRRRQVGRFARRRRAIPRRPGRCRHSHHTHARAALHLSGQ
jgi:5-methylthioadenosine/S-adenosylhomocysteine deaminase